MLACLHKITINSVVQTSFNLCVPVNMNKPISLRVCACSFVSDDFEECDIVSEFDFFQYVRTTIAQSAPPCFLRLPRGVRHRDSNCSWLARSPHHDISPRTSGRSHSPSITFSESSLSLTQKKAKVRSVVS